MTGDIFVATIAVVSAAFCSGLITGMFLFNGKGDWFRILALAATLIGLIGSVIGLGIRIEIHAQKAVIQQLKTVEGWMK